MKPINVLIGAALAIILPCAFVFILAMLLAGCVGVERECHRVSAKQIVCSEYPSVRL